MGASAARGTDACIAPAAPAITSPRLKKKITASSVSAKFW